MVLQWYYNDITLVLVSCGERVGEKYWKILVIMYEGSGFDDSEEQWRRS